MSSLSFAKRDIYTSYALPIFASHSRETTFLPYIEVSRCCVRDFVSDGGTCVTKLPASREGLLFEREIVLQVLCAHDWIAAKPRSEFALMMRQTKLKL